MTTRSNTWGRRAAGLAIAFGVVAAAGPAAAQDPALARGRALYEARCDDCHDRSVHQAASRKARSWAELRAAVVRWDRERGGLWRDDEVEAVTRYLNDRYYRLPCPVSVCGAPPAPERTSMAPSPAAR